MAAPATTWKAEVTEANLGEFMKHMGDRIVTLTTKGDFEEAQRAQQEMTDAVKKLKRAGVQAMDAEGEPAAAQGAPGAAAASTTARPSQEENLRRLAGAPAVPRVVAAAPAAASTAEGADEKLKLLVAIHDDAIRQLKAVCLTTIMVNKSSAVAEAVATAGRQYAVMTKGKSPQQHMLGPPSPVKFSAMLEWAKTCSEARLRDASLRYDREFWQSASQETRAKAVRLFQASNAFDKTRVKWEFGCGPEPIHQQAVQLAEWAAATGGGQLLQGPAPRGALVQDIQKSLPQRAA